VQPMRLILPKCQKIPSCYAAEAFLNLKLKMHQKLVFARAADAFCPFSAQLHVLNVSVLTDSSAIFFQKL